MPDTWKKTASKVQVGYSSLPPTRWMKKLANYFLRSQSMSIMQYDKSRTNLL